MSSINSSISQQRFIEVLFNLLLPLLVFSVVVDCVPLKWTSVMYCVVVVEASMGLDGNVVDAFFISIDLFFLLID